MIEINNLTEFSINEKSFKKLTNNVLIGEGKEGVAISIAFIKKEEIRKLNKQYLKRDYPTDVLSFSEAEVDYSEKKEQVGVKNILGEIVICPSQVKKNAKELGFTFKKELNRVLIHGILHLLGYNHEGSEKEAKRMKKKEDYYFALAH
jgi:probable rRNA maturation factor